MDTPNGAHAHKVSVRQTGATSLVLPELWLLRRFIPHLHNPHLTERRDENIVVFGESNRSDI